MDSTKATKIVACHADKKVAKDREGGRLGGGGTGSGWSAPFCLSPGYLSAHRGKGKTADKERESRRRVVLRKPHLVVCL